MKHKMSKKVLCLCMVAVLAIGLAIPTFADWNIQPEDGSDRYLNIAGSLGSSPSRRYLSLYATSQVNSDQTFRLMRKSGTTSDGYVLCAAQDIRYAVNRTSSGRAWMWDLSQNGYNDSRLLTPRSDPANLLVSYSYGRIGYSGSNVYFGTGAIEWGASGTPNLPLYDYSVVPINAYIA